MRHLCRRLLFLSGITLICARLYPFDQADWVSHLFCDDIVYARGRAFSLGLIRDSGLSLSLSESYVTNLATLTRAVVIILEAVGLALLFFGAARKLR